MFNYSRILEGIADYIPSLDQGLAVLTNSTLRVELRVELRIEPRAEPYIKPPSNKTI